MTDILRCVASVALRRLADARGNPQIYDEACKAACHNGRSKSECF
jgi:hypothetical protein